MTTYALIAWLCLALLDCGAPIRITRLVVPTVASYGDVINLDCAYDLGSDKLYDVKWYKDLNEFFRCKADGGVQAFEVEGIDLYRNYRAPSGSCPVTITVLNAKSAGKYLCEVSSEAPEFKTAARWVNLKTSEPAPSKRIQVKEPTTAPSVLENEIASSTSLPLTAPADGARGLYLPLHLVSIGVAISLIFPRVFDC